MRTFTPDLSVFSAKPWLLPAVLAVITVGFPLVGTSDRWIRVAALALIYVGLASGLNILVGMTGLAAESSGDVTADPITGS